MATPIASSPQPQAQSQALTRRTSSSSNGDDSALMPPPPPVKRIKRPATVLDEDEYTDALSRIIARDYFPGLLETGAKQDYLDALQSKDKTWIARAGRQLEEVMTPGRRHRRRGVSLTPRVGGSGTTPLPAAAATPKGWTGDTPLSVAGSEVSAATESGTAASRPPGVDTDGMSLAAFQAKYTSEDNESFNKLLEKQNEKRRLRYAWLWNDNKIPSARQIAHRKRELKHIEARRAAAAGDGDGSVDDKQLIKTDLDARPARPDAWKANPRNALMFGPDSVEDSHETRQEKAEADSRMGPRQVVYENTRVPAASAADERGSPARPPSPTASAIHDAIAGRPRGTASDAGYMGSETPRVNGYAFVDEDEPSGADAALEPAQQQRYMSLLTAGGVDATPSPFTIRDNRKREELHHRMVERVAKSKRTEKTAQASKTPVPKFPSSPMIAFGRTPASAASSSTPRAPGSGGGGGLASSKTVLTPAAQRLYERVGKTPRSGSTPSAGSSGLQNMWTPTPKRKKG
ncbi:hypothetical protein KEM52_004817 [Ascosphaera acerosa]|nr:hypothetical protein KEM52_004817 [Ascosphaera acerosa]